LLPCRSWLRRTRMMQRKQSWQHSWQLTCCEVMLMLLLFR
jgi:hypothetical protein